MIIARTQRQAKRVENCHHGHGTLWMAELLADYRKQDAGFKYSHDLTNGLEGAMHFLVVCNQTGTSR